jgi:RND superfamily putative drug exporter
MIALATWCVRHRRTVLVIWILVLLGATGLARGVGSAYTNNFSLPNTESTKALSLLQSSAPAQSGDREQVVFHSTNGDRMTDPAVQARVEATLAGLGKLPGVSNIVGPYGTAAATQISKDGSTAFANVTFDELAQNVPVSEAKQFVATAQRGATAGLEVAVAGQLGEEADRQSFGGTLPGVILAGVVLYLVFGSVFAMLLPLGSALASLGTAIGVIELLSHVLKMPVFSTELVLLIGLGVGVDYALFIVTRHRQGLIAGGEVEDSIANAVNTSGRAVLFAGIIVCIALLGMFALGVSFLYGLAVAAALGVAFTMIAALTLLPALLGFLGHKVLSRKQKHELATSGPRIVGAGTKGFWPRWADFIKRQPVLPAVVALIVIVLVALPFFSLRLGLSDQGNDPVGSTTRTAYDLLADGFGPGFNGPLLLVTDNPGPADHATLERLSTSVAGQPDVARVAPPLSLPEHGGRSISLIDVYPRSAPEDKGTTDLIDHLRSTTIPEVTSGSGVTVYVGGNTAIFFDFSKVLTSKLPLFIGLVVALSFILLSVVFRSLLIPLTAAAMNLLSIGAAFGIMVGVFQWGWGKGLGSSPGPIDSWLPVMMFAILFGLSMDYEVFLVSRIHEEWLRSRDNATAVRNGLAATGKTITAAALIMILVFGAFIFGGIRVIKEFGLGLSAGILMDAVIIRMAIVPSLMFMFGRANWWFPSWLDRVLPRLSVDPGRGRGGGRPGPGGPPSDEPEGPRPAPREPETVPV